MNFLNPLGLLFLFSVPLLILLYFLKLKRPEVSVSSTLLWQKVIEDMRVNSPFQRLRKSLLLLLQLILLLLLIFALSRPFLAGNDQVDSSIIVLVDTSASMGARDAGGKLRIDLAKVRIRDLIDNLGRNEELMIIGYNNQAEQLTQFSSNKRQLRDALDRLVATDRPTDIRKGLALAKSIADSRDNKRLLLLSDGAFPDPGSVDLPVDVEYEMIGTPQDNLAITSLDIRRDIRDRRKIEMFVAVQNFADRDWHATMNVFLDDKLLDSKPFDIIQRDTVSQIFEADLPEGGNVKVEFDVDDALKRDNVAWQVVDPPKVRRIVIVGNRTFFVEQAFKTSPDTLITAIGPDAYTPDVATGAACVIWDLVPNPGIAATHNLYIGCVPELPGLGFAELVKTPVIETWDATSPINRFIDYSDLLIGEAATMVLPDTARPILSSKQTPLIVTVPHEEHQLCIVGFNAFKSNWPFIISYPLFLHNVVNWFETEDASRVSNNVAVGQTILLGKQTKPPTIVTPSGRAIALRPSSTEQYSFSGVDTAGVYRIQLGASPSPEDKLVSANLFDPVESNLTPNENPILDGERANSIAIDKKVDREYAKYLLIAALFLLLLEWYIYHRRIFT